MKKIIPIHPLFAFSEIRENYNSKIVLHGYDILRIYSRFTVQYVS